MIKALYTFLAFFFGRVTRFPLYSQHVTTQPSSPSSRFPFLCTGNVQLPPSSCVHIIATETPLRLRQYLSYPCSREQYVYAYREECLCIQKRPCMFKHEILCIMQYPGQLIATQSNINTCSHACTHAQDTICLENSSHGLKMASQLTYYMYITT